jgi:hypothetical protein
MIAMYVVLYLDILVFAMCIFIYKTVMRDINEKYARKEARKVRLSALHELLTVFVPYIIHKKVHSLKWKLRRKIKKNDSNSEV